MQYNVFFLHEWQLPEPMYYFVDQVEASNPWEAIENHLPNLARRVREWMEVDKSELDDGTIEESLYVVRTEDWMSAGMAYSRGFSNAKL